MGDRAASPVKEGDVLAGKYRVERVLGAGGMGVVVAARHEQLDQLVAIKFVRAEALGDGESVSRFLREARAAVKLKSEHAAKVLDVGKLESGAPYMVMEYLEGRDLGQVLEADGLQPAERAIEWVLQACEAVAEAHAAGIVHRDLKPQNLFLARTIGGMPRVKVLDFGVSKSIGTASGEIGSLTRTRAMLGSPLYMSPEQMRSSRDVDPRADVWALGVVLFELLTRRWPFEAETMPELCLKVVSDPPLSLAALRPDVPPPVVAVVERCLAKNPADRFANAADLASALEPFVPPASRIPAHRARLAMASSPNMAVPSELASSPTLLDSSGASAAPTPAAWGSGGRTAPSPGSRRPKLAVWAGGAAIALAGLVALAMRHGPARPDAPTVAAPPAVALKATATQPSASAGPVASGSATPIAALEAPQGAATIAPPPSAAASPVAAGAPPRAAAPPAGASAPNTKAQAPHAHPKPSAVDDDIPALR